MTISEDVKKLISEFHATTDKTLRHAINTKIKEVIKNKPAGHILELSNIEIIGIDFSGLDLSAADFSKSTLKDVNFTGCTLTHAIFNSHAHRNRKQIMANFTGATCIGTDFSTCDLRQSIFDKTTIDDAKFYNTWLDRSVLTYLLPHAKVQDGIQPKISLDNISLEGANLEGMHLTNLYLRRVYYKSTNLQHTKFDNTDIYGSFFQKAKGFDLVSVENAINKDRASYAARTEDKHRKLKSVLRNVPKIETFFKRKREEFNDNCGEKKEPTEKKARVETPAKNHH